MINQRSEGIVNNFNKYTYHIFGCGAIGSSTTLQLVRMGAESIVLYDMDKVEDANIGVSQYDNSHITLPKTTALKAICKSINPDVRVLEVQGEFNHPRQYKYTTKDIAILGFDSMKTRLYAVKCILSISQPDYLIDARMGSQTLQQYVIPNPTLSQYKKTWYSDEKGDSEPCNAKATSYCSNMIGSFICDTIKKILKKELIYGEMLFDFPSFIFDYNHPIRIKELKF